MPHKVQLMIFSKVRTFRLQNKAFIQRCIFLALFSHMEHLIHVENDMIINSLLFLEIACPHCKNIWVTSSIFWSSQLHDCCVRDTLQTSKDASNLIQSVVEKLLYFVRLGSSCRRPINQHFL